ACAVHVAVLRRPHDHLPDAARLDRRRRHDLIGHRPHRGRPLGVPGSLRVDAPVARQHQQRPLRRPPVLALDVAVLRRAQLLRQQVPAQGHPGRADRHRQADRVPRLGQARSPGWSQRVAEHLVPLRL
ncbi:MAG: hypothetical protein AVDCRST_MAG34-2011, partial [uncultured Nocardioidaceae bacterium]